MTGPKTVITFMCLLVLPAVLSGCAGMDNKKVAEGVTFRKIGGFTERNGQGRIRLVTYSGEAEKGNIEIYANKLGCGMLFAFYYPESTDMNDVPVAQLESARNFVEAREVMFKGEGVGKWSFASQCLGLIPTVTDCVESPISTNCR